MDAEKYLCATLSLCSFPDMSEEDQYAFLLALNEFIDKLSQDSCVA